MFKEQLATAIAVYTKLDILFISKNIESPPDPKLGDYALPCFVLAAQLKKKPESIAQDLANNLHLPESFISVEAKGMYLNFFLKPESIARYILPLIHKQKIKYGDCPKQKKLVLIESPGPNTNKPLHLGHVRNMLLGTTIANLYIKAGFRVKKVDIVNDRGIHICKSMLAYQKFGNSQKPTKKSDHFVGDFYVRYAQELKNHPELEQESYAMLQAWENHDPHIRTLWKTMTTWALQGFQETFTRYGVAIEKTYYESQHYEQGKSIVHQALAKGIFTKDNEGNIIADLAKQGLGQKVVLRADGTSIYITQDIALAHLRYKDFKMQNMIYVVGSEQIYHFKSLFAIFALLKYPFAKNCFHLAYGMVYLPEGKLKSREGKVVDADNLATDMHALAKAEVLKRYPELAIKEVDHRAEAIAMAAIKFYILRHDAMKDITFNPEESLSFEGETGPYLQYTYARFHSILKKYNKPITPKIIFEKISTPEEKMLLTLLLQFPALVQPAVQKPSLIARYALNLAQQANEYYHKQHILSAEPATIQARILLISCTNQALQICLTLLGIEALSDM